MTVGYLEMVRLLFGWREQRAEGFPTPDRSAETVVFFAAFAYIGPMATQLDEFAEPGADLWSAINAGLGNDSGTAAREHLAAGFPIYYSDRDTPANALIKEYPDGHRELVRFDHEGEHRVAAIG